MRTITHRLTGATGALTWALTAPHHVDVGPIHATIGHTLSTPHTLVLVAAAVATSGGALSPDVDNQRWWKATIGQLSGAFAHRRLTHWWGIPALAAAILTTDIPSLTVTSPTVTVAAWGAILGWTLHILGDAVFGAACVGRGPGIPITPTRHHVGIGLKADGITERIAAWLLGVTVPALAAALAIHTVTGWAS